MEANKYMAPDSEGLQIVERQDLPEVVPNQTPPTLVHRGSFHSPEAYHTPVDESQSQKQPLYFADTGAAPGTGYSGPPPQYPNEKRGLSGVEAGGDKRERRICGMKRRVAITVFAIVAFVIVIAVVLGAVLGTVLSNNHNDKNPSNNNSTATANLPQPLANSGLSILQPENDSRVYSYYQSSNGSIFENQYSSNPWQSANAVPSVRMVAANDILESSPIASISYTLRGMVYRQLFFFDSNGIVTTTNVTGNGTWSQPYNIASNAASFPKTPTLSVCVDTRSGGLNGIRIYYGGTSSAGNYIQEAGLDFDESVEFLTWHIWFTFTGSDSGSGAACSIMGTQNHVYLYNTTSNNMVQWSWEYSTSPTTTHWLQGNSSLSSNDPMAKGSTVAVAGDDISTDYVFYQTTQNQTVRTLWTDGGFSNYQANIPSLAGIGIGDSISAAYIGGNSILVNQNGTASNQILYTSDNRAGSLSSGSTTA